jgi:hypothetical protein
MRKKTHYYIISIIFVLSIFSFPCIAQKVIKINEISLDSQIIETSGLIYYNNNYFSHNDSQGLPQLYVIDSTSGNVNGVINTGIYRNRDWEDIALFDNNIFVGDIGNNSGARTDLKIYKLSASDNFEKPSDSTHFVFEDQTVYERNFRNTPYDCEAFFVYKQTAYIFSKDWETQHTTFYKLSLKHPYDTARVICQLDVDCLITSADFLPETQTIACTGYEKGFPIKPIIIFISFDSENEKINSIIRYRLPEKNRQIEAITWLNHHTICITNEFYTLTPAKMSWYDVSDFTNIKFDYSTDDNNTILTPLNIFGKYKIFNISNKKLKADRISKKPCKSSIILPDDADKIQIKTKTSTAWIYLNKN